MRLIVKRAGNQCPEHFEVTTVRSMSYRFRKVSAFVLLTAITLPSLVFGSPVSGDKKLTEEQKIIHVLNRLGFGARPGDVEKVKAIGLQKYIDQQLNPASINDSAAEAKLQN